MFQFAHISLQFTHTSTMTNKQRKAKNKGIVLIKKSNNLIESRYKFDIWETRVFLSVLAQIRREDTEFQVYRIWYKDVIKNFELKSGDSYHYLREAAKSLMGKSFFVSYEHEEGVVREKQYHILREIDYLKEGEDGKAGSQEYIDVTIEQKMKPLLLQLQQNFTAYDLRNIVKLSVYPVRIYELLKQYERIGKRKLYVEDIKKMFEVTDKYTLFADFNRWVIKPSIKQINKYTDITITDVEKIKSGRKIVALRFIFHSKRSTALQKARGESTQNPLDLVIENVPSAKPIIENIPQELQETETDKLFTEFQKDVVERFGVTPSVFLQLLNTYNKTQVGQAIRVTNRAKYNNQIKSNVAGFFIKALKEGYTDPEEEKKKKKKNLEKKQKEIVAKVMKLEEEKESKINDKIRELTTQDLSLTDEAIKKLNQNPVAKIVLQKKRSDLGRDLEIEDYRQDKMLREMVKTKIITLRESAFKKIFSTYNAKIKKAKSM